MLLLLLSPFCTVAPYDPRTVGCRPTALRCCRHHTCLYARRRTFFSCAHHSTQFIQHCTFPMWAHGNGSKVKGIRVAHFSSPISISFVMSLLDGPLGRFLPVTSSPTCSLSRPSASSTSFGGSRQNSCASAHCCGMSGCLANPTPNTSDALGEVQDRRSGSVSGLLSALLIEDR